MCGFSKRVREEKEVRFVGLTNKQQMFVIGDFVDNKVFFLG